MPTLDLDYYSLGPNKRLCDIVFAGSHDAGINDGDDNVKTQKLDIYGQAVAGVRLFDLRIAGSRLNADAPVTLNAYHAAMPSHSKPKTQRIMELQGDKRKVTVSSMNGGGFGLGLSSILAGAKRFVTEFDSEFLILKFDKCTNWEIIAEACLFHLKERMYRGFGSLNEKTLRNLSGSVVVVFKHKTLSSLKNHRANRAYDSQTDGIFGCKSLSTGDAFEQTDCSLQYVGKGGTSALNGASDMDKIIENIETQKRRIDASAGRDPRMLGMIYWTTTGFTKSIRKRNKAMWTPPAQEMLRDMWRDCLQESITSRAGDRWDFKDYSNAAKIKTYMPNIVMIDFASLRKCTFIRGLNDTAGTMFTDAVRNA